MAAQGQLPVLNSPEAARAAFEADLPKVLRGRTLAELGWERWGELGLYVPITGVRESGERDDYLLRLHFGHYPDWPPSALFVHPETKAPCGPNETFWLPKLKETKELAIHANYNGRDYSGQLICSSVTLEFYRVLHPVEVRHVWRHPNQNFGATIRAVERALRQPIYGGRQRDVA